VEQKVGSTDIGKVQELVQAIFGFSVITLKRFTVVEALARAGSRCEAKKRFSQFSEGPRIGSSDFRIQCEPVKAIWSGGPKPGLRVAVLPKIGSTDFWKVQELVQAIFRFSVNI